MTMQTQTPNQAVQPSFVAPVAPAVTQHLDDYGEKLGGAKKDHFAFLKANGDLSQRLAHYSRIENLSNAHLTSAFYAMYKKPSTKQILALNVSKSLKAQLVMLFAIIGKKPTRSYYQGLPLLHAKELAKAVTLYHSFKYNTTTEQDKTQAIERLRGVAVRDIAISAFELKKAYLSDDTAFYLQKMLAYSHLLNAIDESLWSLLTFEYSMVFATYISGLATNHVHLSFYFNKTRQTVTLHEEATFGELIDAFAQRIQRLAPTVANAPKKSSDGLPDMVLYRMNSTKLYFIACKKDPLKTPLYETYDANHAREVIAQYRTNSEYHEILSQAWQKVLDKRFTLNDLHPKNDGVRQAPNHRTTDTTPQEFAEVFGVRGVEFGNWVKQGKERHARQDFLNKSFDAFADLALLLGETPKFIGLSNTLGFAMGSRGSGNASAHYELDFKVINLTKTRGNGSVAHEWLHAYDHAKGIDAEIRGFYSTSQINALMRIPTFKAVADRAEKLDRLMGKSYYRTAHEMTARYFESVMLYKLQKMGYVNDFLVKYLWRGDFMECDTYPYVMPSEVNEHDFNEFLTIMGLTNALF